MDNAWSFSSVTFIGKKELDQSQLILPIPRIYVSLTKQFCLNQPHIYFILCPLLTERVMQCLVEHWATPGRLRTVRRRCRDSLECCPARSHTGGPVWPLSCALWRRVVMAGRGNLGFGGVPGHNTWGAQRAVLGT